VITAEELEEDEDPMVNDDTGVPEDGKGEETRLEESVVD